MWNSSVLSLQFVFPKWIYSARWHPPFLKVIRAYWRGMFFLVHVGLSGIGLSYVSGLILRPSFFGHGVADKVGLN
jgi:hypothetical protein